jgi:hypothetical protein
LFAQKQAVSMKRFPNWTGTFQRIQLSIARNYLHVENPTTQLQDIPFGDNTRLWSFAL